MYTTAQIVEMVSIRASDWSPEKVLNIIREIDWEMSRGNTELVENIDQTTGLPFMLETTDGTLTYSMPDNCRKIKDVRVRATDRYETYNSKFSYRTLTYLGEVWYSLLNVETRPRTRTAAAYLVFPDNPGTTTGRYYVPYWIQPTAVTALTSQLNVHPDYHGLLIDGVMARIESYQFGDNTKYERWLERMKIEYWGDANWNPPQMNFTPARPC